MKIIDAYILARTKRKTRRIRTALVIIVSSLLFAVLFAVALVAAGARDGINQVKDVGFNGRNIVSVVSQSQQSSFGQAEYERILEEMKNELRARKITITEETERDPSFAAELGRRMGNLISKLSIEQNAKLEDNIRRLGKPEQIYHFTAFGASGTDLAYQPDPAKDPLVDELTKQVETKVPPKGKSMDDSLQFHSVEADMLRTQLHPGQRSSWQPGQPYPLWVSYAYLEKLSGKSFSRASAAEKNEGNRKLMSEYGGREITYCYRNYVAQEQLQSVIKYNYDAKNDKKADTKPIDVPNCGGFDQAVLKKLGIITEEKEPETKPLFPLEKQPAPDTAVMKFKLIGFISSPAPYGTSDPISQLLNGISALPTGSYPGVVPAEVVNQDARLKGFSDPAFGFAQPPALFADFKTRQAQIDFIKQSCEGNECTSGAKPYIAPFGNIGLVFDGLLKQAMKVITVALIVVIAIAALMMLFTISKVIADSTREIAVFRALGARRRDIAQIYFTYGFMLAGSAAVVAFTLASIAAAVLTNMYAELIAEGLIAASGAFYQPVSVTLWAIEPVWILGVVAALAAAAIIGIAFPVLLNLRRKLINALREE